METELNDKELEEVAGGFENDGKIYNIKCIQSDGHIALHQNVRGTAMKDSILAKRASQGYKCTLVDSL